MMTSDNPALGEALSRAKKSIDQFFDDMLRMKAVSRELRPAVAIEISFQVNGTEVLNHNYYLTNEDAVETVNEAK